MHTATPRQTLWATNNPEGVKEVSSHAEGHNESKQSKIETSLRYDS